MGQVSIIIPTYNEEKNVSELIKKLEKELKGIDHEIIFVDDNSYDKTVEIIKRFIKKYPVKIIVRKKKRDLSKSVVEGFKVAKGEIIGVMDADMCHPPEAVKEMIKLCDRYDLVIGSRWITGSRIINWPFRRRFISGAAKMLARPLIKVKDPMSGFFFLRKKVISNIKFKVQGYKILLEILVKGRYKEYYELPILFSDRMRGSSKINRRVYLNYIIHILRLYRWKILR